MPTGAIPMEGTPRWARLGSLRLGAVLRAVTSFEVCFVLFLFAGSFKEDPRLSWFPVDLTLFLGALSLVAGAGVAARRVPRATSRAWVLVALFALFSCFSLISLAWAPGVVYATRKAFLLSSLVLWAVVGSAIVIAGDETRVWRFLGALLALGLMFGLEAAVGLAQAVPGQVLRIVGGNYLELARATGIGVVLAFGVALTGKGNPALRTLGSIVAVALLGLMLAIGGRGPLLAVLLSLAVPVLAGVRLSRRNLLLVRRAAMWLAIAGAAFLAIVAYLLWTGDERVATIRRLAVLITEGGGQSALRRLYFYQSALELWREHPILGSGIGGWPVLTLQLDVRAYPHNLFLETLAELGLVGFVLLVGILGTGLWALKQGRAGRPLPPILLLVTMLLVNAGVNAMVSGDLADNRFLFAMLGLAAGASTRGEAEPQQQTGEVGRGG
jgi:O-antigen ligase